MSFPNHSNNIEEASFANLIKKIQEKHEGLAKEQREEQREFDEAAPHLPQEGDIQNLADIIAAREQEMNRLKQESQEKTTTLNLAKEQLQIRLKQLCQETDDHNATSEHEQNILKQQREDTVKEFEGKQKQIAEHADRSQRLKTRKTQCDAMNASLAVSLSLTQLVRY